MKPINLHALLRAARRCPTPVTDVADAVVASLYLRGQKRTKLNRPLLMISLASSAAAAAAIVAAIVTLQTNGIDSAEEVLRVVSWAMQ